MIPNVSIVCTQGAHATALQYAKLVSEAGLPLLVNFPSEEGYARSTDPSQLVNQRTGAAIILISEDLFPPYVRSPSIRIDNEIFQNILSMPPNARSRLFLITTDEISSERIIETLMGKLQWTPDSVHAREELLVGLSSLAESDQAGDDISAFSNIASLILDIEPGYTVTPIASEQVSSDKVSYEIFKCVHKINEIELFYIHLHRGIAIANTANDLKTKHPEVLSSLNKFVVLSIEKGQVRVNERIENIKTALQCDKVDYLENIVSKLLSGTDGTRAGSNAEDAARSFVEPEVRKGFGSESQPTSFSLVRQWLGSSRPGVLVVVGQGGIGKTWAMLDLRKSITNGKISFTKPIARTVIFISSTDVARGFGRLGPQIDNITLYDLYNASRLSITGERHGPHHLNRETFYNALELGSLVVFVDGLDEVITRNRSRFNAAHFFDDLTDRLTGESDGKVIISCRNIFFDQEGSRLNYPFVETVELLAFDEERRTRFFHDHLQGLPRRIAKAIELSDRMAKLPDGRYVPFVLDLITEMTRDAADDSLHEPIELFQSEILNPNDPNDRIIGQFCNRETVKIQDPLHELSVDQQVGIFCSIARQGPVEREGGSAVGDQAAHTTLETIISRHVSKKDVRGYAEHFITHPFISQEEFRKRGIVTFRFDFMPEYFLMVDAIQRINGGAVIEEDDIRILNKYCAITSPFCVGIATRLTDSESEFRIKLIQMLEQAWEIITDRFPPEDLEILLPDSAAARFSFAVVSMLATVEARSGPINVAEFTDALLEVFGENRTLRRVALLDGFVREDERLRIDFRGLRVEESLFHSVDIWSCQYDDQSSFSNCKFMDCLGVFAKSSGIQLATFEHCQLDAEFERIYESGSERITNTEAQNVGAIRSFVSDFYRQGGFHPKNKNNVERFYGQSNSAVPFNKIYKLMKKHRIVEEIDRGHYVHVKISNAAASAAERLITQGVIVGPLQAVAIDLR